ncbi:MAG: amino acid permease [Gammaproteobacteria bacterium]
MPALQRSLSWPSLAFYGLGNILGAGIYVLVGKVAGVAGPYTPWAFLIALVLALFTALSYAELASRFPFSAGESVYLQEGLGVPFLSVGVGLLIVLAGVLSSAAIVQSFVAYLEVFVSVPRLPAVAVVVALLGGVAAWGISASVRVAVLFTVLEIAGLVLVIGAGSGALAQLPERAAQLRPPLTWDAWHGLLFGALLAFYAFIGFEDMVNVAEEVKAPERAMPAAIITALAVAAVLYILVALVAVLAVSPQQLAASNAPLALIYHSATGRAPVLVSVIALFAVINGALIQIIMGSRVLYGLSAQGWLPPLLSRIHPRRHTPVLATALVAAAVLVLALSFSVQGLAEHTSLVILLVFVLVNWSLWRVKRRAPRPAGVRVFPAWVPVAGGLSSAAFVLFELIRRAAGW